MKIIIGNFARSFKKKCTYILIFTRDVNGTFSHLDIEYS